MINGKKVEQSPNKSIPFVQELWRKSIHLCSLSIPITYYFITKELALSILIPLALIFILFDIFSRKENWIRHFIIKYFGKLMRPYETKDEVSLNGASWVLISACIVIFAFPKLLAITSFSILIISDISAAIFGRKYGSIPIFDKSLEGTIAFIISAFMVILFIGYLVEAPWTYFLCGMIAAIVGGIVEVSSSIIKFDDNLTIPISISLLMWGGGLIAASLNQPFIYWVL